MINKQKWIFLVVALLMMGGAMGVLAHLKTNHRLGQPGVKTGPSTNGQNMEVILPEHVLDYTSERVEQDTNTVNYLPDDTCYGSRRYTAPDSSWVQASVVLMGSDRSSLHKPDYCLPGHGWRIDNKSEIRIPIEGSDSYQLPVMKWTMTTFREPEAGQKIEIRGLFLFWYVADGEQTVNHSEIMWRIAMGLLRTGRLQRWSSVSYFAYCAPGQEEQTFEHLKKLIAASVPEFQKIPGSKEQAVTATQ